MSPSKKKPFAMRLKKSGFDLVVEPVEGALTIALDGAEVVLPATVQGLLADGLADASGLVTFSTSSQDGKMIEFGWRDEQPKITITDGKRSHEAVLQRTEQQQLQKYLESE